jgi:hypothetical protein
MSLYTRLIGGNLLQEGEQNIYLHQFASAMAEVEKGKMTAAEVAAAQPGGLNAAEQVEAAALSARIINPSMSVSLGNFVVLTNVGATYDSSQAARGLPMIEMQMAGITGLKLTIRVEKVGTGVQSWQLWNETDSAEIMVFDDNGAAGVKTLSNTRTFSPALAPGYKVARLRAKSTVVQDDPIYLSGTLVIERVERLTSVDFEDVCVLAASGWKYTTEAELKARLGV